MSLRLFLSRVLVLYCVFFTGAVLWGYFRGGTLDIGHWALMSTAVLPAALIREFWVKMNGKHPKRATSNG